MHSGWCPQCLSWRSRKSPVTVSDPVRVEGDNGVAVVTVDNPPVNAMSLRVFEGLHEAATELDTRDDIRVVVLTGAGPRSFMAGADITEFEHVRTTPGESSRRLMLAQEVFARWAALRQPTIAAIQAPAIGGGLEAALLCDFIVSARDTVLGLPEVKLGLVPGAGGNTRLAQRVGPSRAKELAMLGDPISSLRAFEIGLVDHLAAPGATLSVAVELASRLAERPAVAVQMVKRAVDASTEADTATALRFEREAYEVAHASADAEEGYRAFLDHRAPVFRHR